ncbi:hypothetical protein [Streptomyces sp. RerS4]|uniref:hypothetical protein n=1 Tax=Streptomyces sp. RerS4 TaxID=2942449 RepID=UPI00201CA7CB|nr:hypothetical protein [Streptomyces sp. RerS4]UQW99173.1 hypothetical protein M4D82_00425 [Streptomyces sp. RerS4]
MPYSRDKADLAMCREKLGIPANYLRRMRQPNGRISLDTEAQGQQQLQALLFDCFFSRGAEHPFDLAGGRTFPDLLSYLGWVAPQADRIILQVTTAARVTSYLVPYVRTFSDNSHEVSGIPGLRLERLTRKALLLRHLPTEGRIEVREKIGEVSLQDMQNLLEEEVRASRFDNETKDRRRPAWTQDHLTTGEAAMARHWAPTPTTALRSALLARANLWWTSHRHRAHLAPARRSNAERCLRWANGSTAAEIGRLLTDSPLRIPAARFTPPSGPEDVGLIRLGDGILELKGEIRV